MLTQQRETAIAAFHALGPKSEAQRERVVSFIAARGGSWSIGELSEALGMQKSTVSARLNELLHSGDLSERPKRRDRCSGIQVRPVGLPVTQGELFDGGE